MKDGKLPIAKRNDYVSPAEAFGGGELELQPEIMEYLKKKGLGHKWLSTRKLKLNNGRHLSGWLPFQVPEELKKVVSPNPFGTAPDGYISVGDLVLGVKPLKGQGVTVESHKKVLAQRVEDKTRQAFGAGQGSIKVIPDNQYE